MLRIRSRSRTTKDPRRKDDFNEAESEPAEVERDEDQAPVSAKEELKCCLLLISYFVRSDEDSRIIQSDLEKMLSIIRKNHHARAKQLDMRDFIY